MGFAIASVIALAVFKPLVGASNDLNGASGVVAALAWATWFMTYMVAWGGGAVLALRARSRGWLIAVALLGPFGAVLCALYCRPRTGSPP